MNQLKPNGLWVRLYLEKQSNMSRMPDHVVGFLTEETPGAYVLSKVVTQSENEDTFEVVQKVEERIHFVNRTYVWCCEVLGATLPDLSLERPAEDGLGGLG